MLIPCGKKTRNMSKIMKYEFLRIHSLILLIYNNLFRYFSIVLYRPPGGSDSKESACNVGELGLIPGLKDLLEKGKATHSSILAWRMYSPWGHKELGMTE